MEDRLQGEGALWPVVNGAGPRRLALSAALLTLMAAELVWLFSGWRAAQVAGQVAAIVFILIDLRLAVAGLRQGLLFVLAIGLTAWIAATHADPGATLSKALDQGTYLMAFILLISLLREGAQSSPAVLACGNYLTHQPPGRRYLSLHGGSHLLAVLINFGAISLLAPLVMRGVRASLGLGEALSEIWRVRERRQLCGLYRGMTFIVAWAPTTITQAILPAAIPGIDPQRLIWLGLMAVAITLAVGWLEDRVRWWPLRRRLLASGEAPRLERPQFPARAFLDFALVCASLVGLVIVVRYLASVRTVPALMLSAPIMLIGWLLMQNRHLGVDRMSRKTRRRLAEIVSGSIPDSSIEVFILGLAGFVGVALASIVPIDTVAALLNQSPLPPWAFLAAIPLIMFVVAQFGLTSITVGVIFGTVLGALPELPTDPTLVALALGCGWAIAMMGSPFSSVALLLSRISGHTPVVIALNWNLAYSIASLLALTLFFYVLAG
jgi:hypothetical protein